MTAVSYEALMRAAAAGADELAFGVEETVIALDPIGISHRG